MIITPDFPDHWKTRMLVDLLGGDEMAPVYLIRLWGHCQNQKKSHFKALPPQALKAICHYHGKANELEEALTAAGYIERGKNNSVTVRGWSEMNASLIAAWDNGLRGGRPRKNNNPSKTQAKPTGNPRVTHGEPKRNPDVTDREDRIDKREKSTADLPHGTRFVIAFNAFEEMRRKSRAPYTDKARDLILGKLRDVSESVAVKMLENSIENGWKSVYPLKADEHRRTCDELAPVLLPGEVAE
jgi:hypothetical protein